MLRSLYYLAEVYVGCGSAGTPTLYDPALRELGASLGWVAPVALGLLHRWKRGVASCQQSRCQGTVMILYCLSSPAHVCCLGHDVQSGRFWCTACS